ncbi:MAG TPA: prepilin-type N-terminal cleavage/methylation domain-containing protein, partial [Candidatus Paceibacterota bacterium]|nr:prepilin-type N-terminal cleavage/methylation domain-containing protein [Candidatus Paceibacterota bacterium]
MQASHSLSLRHSGFTIIELLVAVAVASVVGLSIAALARDTVSFNRYYQSSFSVADRAQKLLRPMAEEIRSASQSVAGAYPIDTAGTNEFIFYADIDNDGLVDRVRYYLSGTSLLKDVVAPAGSPLTYTLANAVTTTPVT